MTTIDNTIHHRVAKSIAQEEMPIDYQLLAKNVRQLVQSNIDEEAQHLRELAHQTALLLGQHMRSPTKISAWEAYNNETQ